MVFGVQQIQQSSKNICINLFELLLILCFTIHDERRFQTASTSLHYRRLKELTSEVGAQWEIVGNCSAKLQTRVWLLHPGGENSHVCSHSLAFVWAVCLESGC